MLKPYRIIAFLFLGSLISACFANKSDTISTSINFAEFTKRADWKTAIGWDDECDEGIAHLTKYSDAFVGVELYVLKDQRHLVSVVCETAAYNRGEQIYLETAKGSGKFQQLSFPQFGRIEDAPDGLTFNASTKATKATKTTKTTSGQPYYRITKPRLWGNLRIDTSTATIINNNFYRGGGGCGISSTYSLAGSAAKIETLRLKDHCGQSSPSPSSWPQIDAKDYMLWPEAKKL